MRNKRFYIKFHPSSTKSRDGIKLVWGWILVFVVLLTACTQDGSQALTLNEPSETVAPQPTVQLVTTTPTIASTNTPATNPVTENWEETFSSITWVAYSPPTANPDLGIEAKPDAIRGDLETLRKAGFTGLVTYSADGVLGEELPELAQAAGFQGVIMGIYDPSSQEERQNAENAAASDVVLGYCVGNEGLGKRYQLSELSQAISELKVATGKPATTTEEIDDYANPALLAIGDWVFPNAHPYFHSQTDPDMAVSWTKAAFNDISRRAKRLVVFKEVGLPTAGNPEADLSEANQDRYYQELEESDVRFVYFEGFDQPWKTSLPIEPHWGIFMADQTPKALALRLMEQVGAEALPESNVFIVYSDYNNPGNHFAPTGFMGDIGDILVDQEDTSDPYEGKTAIKINYLAEGSGPNECEGMRPCTWSGVYWQEPPNNWGTDEFWSDSGYDLSEYTRLVFWAKADKESIAGFQVGGIMNPYGDSLEFPRIIYAELTTQWQRFEIDLKDADLTYIIGGFAWVSNWAMSSGSVNIYVDEIQFIK